MTAVQSKHGTHDPDVGVRYVVSSEPIAVRHGCFQSREGFDPSLGTLENLNTIIRHHYHLSMRQHYRVMMCEKRNRQSATDSTPSSGFRPREFDQILQKRRRLCVVHVVFGAYTFPGKPLKIIMCCGAQRLRQYGRVVRCPIVLRMAPHAIRYIQDQVLAAV